MAVLQRLIIPEFPLKYKASNSRRKKYYTKKKIDKIPKKYKTKEYAFKEGYLVRRDTGERVIANPRAAGTPRWERISANTFMGRRWAKDKAAEFLVNEFSKYIDDQLVAFKPEDYPLRIAWDFYHVIGQANFDMTNFWFYWKYLEDSLRYCKIIPDDNIKYITQSPGPLFFPVGTLKERQFVIRFYHDDREELKKWQVWRHQKKDFHLDQKTLDQLNFNL